MVFEGPRKIGNTIRRLGVSPLRTATVRGGRGVPRVRDVSRIPSTGTCKFESSAKLAMLLKKQGRAPLLIACDLARPAAIEQLATLGSQVGVPVFTPRPGRIQKEIRVDLPRPRDFNAPAVGEYASQIMAELENPSDEKQPG